MRHDGALHRDLTKGQSMEMAQAEQVTRILVVDDDEVFRSRLTRALQARGYEAHPAAGAAEAIELARQIHPQRAVVDLRMPDVSGLDLVKALAEIDPPVQV